LTFTLETLAHSGNCDGKTALLHLGLATSVADNVASSTVGNRIYRIRQRKASHSHRLHWNAFRTCGRRNVTAFDLAPKRCRLLGKRCRFQNSRQRWKDPGPASFIVGYLSAHTNTSNQEFKFGCSHQLTTHKNQSNDDARLVRRHLSIRRRLSGDGRMRL
jgi:hypothetical protein